MIHFTCDVCGRDVSESDGSRYVVRIAAYAAFDPDQITQADLDEDHMERVAEALEREARASCHDSESKAYKAFRFDLCTECHERFVGDPLHRDAQRTLNFSKN